MRRLLLTGLSGALVNEMREHPHMFTILCRGNKIFAIHESAFIEIGESQRQDINIKSWRITDDNTVEIYYFEPITVGL